MTVHREEINLSGVHRFAALKTFAEKIVKFDQKKLLPALKQPSPQDSDDATRFSHATFRHLETGICLGLTANWLKEKLTKSNSWRNCLSSKDFARTPTAQAAATIIRRGALRHLPHARDHESVRKVFDGANLDINPSEVEKVRGPDNIPVLDMPAQFARTERDMARGTGVLLQVSVFDGAARTCSGHVAAMYKSRGGHVYFFDSNAGVYQVTRPSGFFDAWVAAYAARGKEVSMHRRGDGFFDCRQKDSGQA